MSCGSPVGDPRIIEVRDELEGHTAHPAFNCTLPFEETELSTPLARPCVARVSKQGSTFFPSKVAPASSGGGQFRISFCHGDGRRLLGFGRLVLGVSLPEILGKSFMSCSRRARIFFRGEFFKASSHTPHGQARCGLVSSFSWQEISHANMHMTRPMPMSCKRCSAIHRHISQLRTGAGLCMMYL